VTNNEPRGVGGWLLLFVFGQVLFAPLRAGEGIWEMWHQIGPHPFPVIRQMAMIIMVIILIMTVYGMIVGILIWKGNKRGRSSAQLYLVVCIGVTLVIFTSLTSWSYNNFGDSAAKRTALGIIGPSAVQIVMCLIWLGYFAFSKRVRNTYCGQAEC
jgi:hypothetical protein